MTVTKDHPSPDLTPETLDLRSFDIAEERRAELLRFFSVASVTSGALIVCLERELTLDLIRAMAERKPERVVCLAAGFADNDQLKANAVQIFRAKGVTSFKTV